MKTAFYELAKNIEKRYRFKRALSTLLQICVMWAILLLLFHIAIQLVAAVEF